MTDKEQALLLQLQQIKPLKSKNQWLFYVVLVLWAVSVMLWLRFPHALWYLVFGVLGFLSFILLFTIFSVNKERRDQYAQQFNSIALQGLLDQWAWGVHYKPTADFSKYSPTNSKLLGEVARGDCFHFFDAPLHHFRLAFTQLYHTFRNNEDGDYEAKTFSGLLFAWRFPDSLFRYPFRLFPKKPDAYLEARHFDITTIKREHKDLSDFLPLEQKPSHYSIYASESAIPVLQHYPAAFWEEWSALFQATFQNNECIAFYFYERDMFAALSSSQLLEPIWDGNRIQPAKTLEQAKKLLQPLLSWAVAVTQLMEKYKQIKDIRF